MKILANKNIIKILILCLDLRAINNRYTTSPKSAVLLAVIKIQIIIKNKIQYKRAVTDRLKLR